MSRSKNLKKIIISLFLGVMLLTPNLVLAQTVLPDFNPICWTKTECVQQRRIMFQLNTQEAEGGFFPNEGDCNGIAGSGDDADAWGKCVPGTVAKTSIAIGGKTIFTSIGDYIATIYYYALGIAGIVAVVVIIVAGIQWIVAAGNSAVIGAAKKRIGGALIGLFLAYSSFFILNSINPWLTKFRLPQVWMVKEVNMMPEFCTDMQDIDKAPGIKFALIADPKNDVKKEIKDIKTEDYFEVFNNKETNKIKNEERLVCNQTFVGAGGAGATCQGDYCGQGGNCFFNIDDNGSENKEAYKCYNNIIMGKVYANYWMEPDCFSIGSGWDYPYVTQATLVLVLEKSQKYSMGTFMYLSYGELKENYSMYIKAESSQFNKIRSDYNLFSQDAKKYGNPLGYVIGLTLDDACGTADKTFYFGKGGQLITSKTIGELSSVSKSDLISYDDIANGLSINIDVTQASPN